MGLFPLLLTQTVIEMFEMLDAIEHNDIKKAAAIGSSFQKSMPCSLAQALLTVKAVLNYMGFAAGPTRLPLVPAPEEDAKRIIKSCG